MQKQISFLFISTLTLCITAMEPESDESDWNDIVIPHHTETFIRSLDRIKAASKYYFAFHNHHLSRSYHAYLIDRKVKKYIKLPSVSCIPLSTVHIHAGILSAANTEIHQWNCATKDYKGALQGPLYYDTVLDLDDYHTKLAACTRRGYLNLFDLETQQCFYSRKTHHTQPTLATIACTTDGTLIAAQTEGFKPLVYLRDTRCKKYTLWYPLPQSTSPYPYGIALDPQKTYMACAQTKNITLYDLRKTNMPLFMRTLEDPSNPLFVNEHTIIIPTTKQSFRDSNTLVRLNITDNTLETKRLNIPCNSTVISKESQELIFFTKNASLSHDVYVYDCSSFFAE